MSIKIDEVLSGFGLTREECPQPERAAQFLINLQTFTWHRAAQSWLHRSVPNFGNRSPKDLLMTGDMEPLETMIEHMTAAAKIQGLL